MKFNPLVTGPMEVYIFCTNVLKCFHLALNWPCYQYKMLGNSVRILPQPSKHAIICQYWTTISPVLPALIRFWPSSTTWWHVYRDMRFTARIHPFNHNAKPIIVVKTRADHCSLTWLAELGLPADEAWLEAVLRLTLTSAGRSSSR